MEPIVIEAQNHSPHIDFHPSGKLKITGRSLPENVAELYNPLIDFARKLQTDLVTFDIILEYFNTASSKKLLELFKAVDVNDKVSQVLVNWHYEKDDEDSLEMAEIYHESLGRSEFRYHEHIEIDFVKSQFR